MKTGLKPFKLLSLAALATLIFWGLHLQVVSAPVPAAQGDDVFASGVQAYSVGNFVQAEKLLATYLRDNPHSMIRDIGLLWYGRALLALHRAAEARGVADSMAKEFPNSPLTQKLREEIQGYEKNGRLSEVEATRNAARAKLPQTKNGTHATAPLRAAAKTEPKRERPRVQTVAAKKNPPSAKKRQRALRPERVGEDPGTGRTSAQINESKAQASRGTNPARVGMRGEYAGKPVHVARLKKPLPMSPAARVSEKPKKSTAAASSEPQRSSRPEAKRLENRKAVSLVRREHPKPEREAKVLPARREPIRKPAVKKETQSAVSKSTQTTTQLRSLRDPFRPLVVRSGDEVPTVLPPGKKGLIINRLEVKGVIKTDEGYIAVVQAGPNSAAIFLREKDSLYDGDVEKIYSDRVIFRRFVTDKLGKVYAEEVTKPIIGSAGF